MTVSESAEFSMNRSAVYSPNPTVTPSSAIALRGSAISRARYSGSAMAAAASMSRPLSSYRESSSHRVIRHSCKRRCASSESAVRSGGMRVSFLSVICYHEQPLANQPRHQLRLCLRGEVADCGEFSDLKQLVVGDETKRVLQEQST